MHLHSVLPGRSGYVGVACTEIPQMALACAPCPLKAVCLRACSAKPQQKSPLGAEYIDFESGPGQYDNMAFSWLLRQNSLGPEGIISWMVTLYKGSWKGTCIMKKPIPCS